MKNKPPAKALNRYCGCGRLMCRKGLLPFQSTDFLQGLCPDRGVATRKVAAGSSVGLQTYRTAGGRSRKRLLQEV